MTLTHLDPQVTFISKSASWIVLVIGVSVLMGWISSHVTFKRIRPSVSAMKPNATLAILPCGAALWFMQGDMASTTKRFDPSLRT